MPCMRQLQHPQDLGGFAGPRLRQLDTRRTSGCLGGPGCGSCNTRRTCGCFGRPGLWQLQRTEDVRRLAGVLGCAPGAAAEGAGAGGGCKHSQGGQVWAERCSRHAAPTLPLQYPQDVRELLGGPRGLQPGGLRGWAGVGVVPRGGATPPAVGSKRLQGYRACVGELAA